MHKGVIDIGNTRIKAAYFDHEGRLIEKSHFLTLTETYQWLINAQVKQVMVSSVKGKAIEDPTDLNIHQLSHNSLTPFKNLYQSKNSLGVDRIAAMSAAAHQFPHQAVLVFDIGTCMTIDYLNAQGEYHGGNISPGLHMRLRAMHEMTGSLPLVTPEMASGEMGRNTQEAIANGALLGMQYEIESYIEKYKDVDLQVVLCGGDCQHFVIPSKYKIFANENFVLEGLYALLLLNEK